MIRTLLFLVSGLAVAFAGSAAAGVETPDPALKAQAKVSQDEAQETALAKVPGGTIQGGELEKEHGKLIWSFDIARPKTTSITEVQVDAVSGKIVSTKTETLKDQAKELKADMKEKHAMHEAREKHEAGESAAQEAKEKK